MVTTKNWLVETNWLADHLSAPGVVVVDATMQSAADDKSGLDLYREGHIPGAVFFDIEEIADTGSSLPHMLPSPEKFASRMRKLGIGDGMKVIVYSNKGLFSAPRAWWMFRVMGHEDVSVLNGGFAKWHSENRPVEMGAPPLRSERHFSARKNSELVRDLSDMKRAVATGNTQIADARSKARFEGRELELRGVPRLGAMPGAKNVPYASLLNSDGTMLPPEQLRKVFQEAGIDPAKPVFTTCGSGITACILALGLALVGNEYASVYDGSWAEWSNTPDAPVVTAS